MLERDPGWTGAPGGFDEIELIPIAEDNASVIAFEAGELDYTVVNVLDYDTLAANPPKGGVVRLAQSVDPFWLGITETAEPLKDIRVRKAIELAVDVPAILAAKSSGRLVQAAGHAAPGTLGARTTAPPARDLEVAKALIAEAGAEGSVIRLDFVSTAADGSNTAAQIIQANLAEIGLVVELNGQDEGTFWSIDSIRGTDPQLHLKSWFGNPDFLYFLQYFTRAQIGSWNWEALQNDEYEALIVQARSTSDDAEHARLYVLVQLATGDPASATLGARASPKITAEFREKLGLDQPMPVQIVIDLIAVGQGASGPIVKAKSRCCRPLPPMPRIRSSWWGRRCCWRRVWGFRLVRRRQCGGAAGLTGRWVWLRSA